MHSTPFGIVMMVLQSSIIVKCQCHSILRKTVSYRGVFALKHKKDRDHTLHNHEDLPCLKVSMKSCGIQAYLLNFRKSQLMFSSSK